MHSFTSIYKLGSLTPLRQKWVLCSAAPVLLALVSVHPALVRAQDVQGIDVDTGRLMVQQPPGQRGEQQSGSQQAPIPLSDGALSRIANILKNLTPAGRDIMLSKVYTAEERQQILSYMQARTPQQEVQPQTQPQTPQLTLEQRRQMMLGSPSETTQQQTVKEETQKTEQVTTQQQKLPPKTLQQQEQVKEEVKQPTKLVPTQLTEQQKLIEQPVQQQVQEGGKQIQTLTPDQQKQLLSQQQLQQQLEQAQQQQLKQEIQQTAKQEQTQTIAPSKPGNPATVMQEKYQKLLDAGVFTTSSGNTPNADSTMTRTQFAMIANKLKDLTGNAETPFSDLPSSFWGELTGAQTIGTIEGSSKPSIMVISDDKKSSADFLALLAEFSKQQSSQAELDALITKIGSPIITAPLAVVPGGGSTVLTKITEVVATMTTPPEPVVMPGGIAYPGTGLAGIQSALAAATAAATSSSDNAKNIALTNTVNALAGIGAEYNVVTPRANFPSNLNATFNGRMAGTLSNSTAVGANLTMNVNFATVGSGAPIGGNIQFDNNKGSASFNSVGYIGGYVGGGMIGTYDGQAMNGLIQNAQFFGPAANAIKGGWSMTTNSVSGSGSFAATR